MEEIKWLLTSDAESVCQQRVPGDGGAQLLGLAAAGLAPRPHQRRQVHRQVVRPRQPRHLRSHWSVDGHVTSGRPLIGQYPGHVTISRPLIGDLLPPPPGDEVHVEAEQEGDGNPRTLLPVDKIIPCSVDIIDRFLTILSKTIFKDIKLPFLRFLKLPAPQYEFFKLLLLFQGTTIPAKIL